MKNLQKNFTTPEQSKRLLELGVPADSADCYYYDWAWIGEQYEGRAIQTCDAECYRHERISHTKPIYPCWSVGRLMEIITVSFKHGVVLTFNSYTKGMSESLISSIVELKEDLDFSKLED